MSTSLTLVPRLDSPAADALARDLKAARGAPSQINAQAVTFCGALSMQLLMAARRQWSEDGAAFQIDEPSKDLLEACRLLGIPQTDIGIEEVTGETK